MKKVILCILGCILLLAWTGAAAEDCTHENQLECGMISGWEDLVDGHWWVETQTCVCDDCGKKIVRRSVGEFLGHTFHMSESIHFEADSMHLWVFICPECWHVTLREQACGGGDQCYIYRTPRGQTPLVHYGDSWVAWQQATTTEDYVKRWIAQDRTE